MGFRLVSRSDRSKDSFHFFVLKEPEINAFAMPAGVIALYSGLILEAHDEREVAGVLAHEIAHVIQDHIARGVEASQNVSCPAMIVAVGLAIVAGDGGADGDAARDSLLGVVTVAEQYQLL